MGARGQLIIDKDARFPQIRRFLNSAAKFPAQ
jgi:hypothetical protein